jgi:predicted amidohydrolase
MPVKNHYQRTANKRFNKVLFALVISIASIQFCYAKKTEPIVLQLENPPRPFTGSNYPAPQYPQWVDDKTGKILFDAEDIVRFDWKKQIFELSRRRAMDLIAHSVGLSHPFTIKDEKGIIYHGTFMSTLSSMSYDGPTITIDGYDKKIRPPLFKIDSSYPSREIENDKRFSTRLKSQFVKTGVLATIHSHTPPEPIERKTTGWQGQKDQLRLWVEYFPETLRIGENARIHLHVIPGKLPGSQADKIEFTIILQQNENEFFCNTVCSYDLKKDNWKDVYIWDSSPWGPVWGAIQAYAKAGPATIKIQARTLDKKNGSKIVENIEIPPIPITILPSKFEKNNTFQVAAIQAISKFANSNHNRRHLEELVRQAAKHGAKVIVLPETANPGYMSWNIQTTWQVGNRKLTQGLRGISPDRVAETIPGDSTRFFGPIAKELAIYLTVPIIEIDLQTNKYYNTLVLMGPEGNLLLHYRKRNPWPHAERGWASKGDRGNVYIDTPYGRMGLLICYDINYEPANLKKLEIDHLLYSIAWVDSKGSNWFTKRLPKIARENHLNIIGANWTLPAGAKPIWHGYGHSLILDKLGNTLARVKQDIGEEIIFAELNIPPKTLSKIKP